MKRENLKSVTKGHHYSLRRGGDNFASEENPFRREKLLGTGKYFVGKRRKVLCDRICEALSEGRSIMIVGLCQIGKSKILDRVMGMLPKAEYFPVLFKFQRDAFFSGQLPIIGQFCKFVIRQLRDGGNISEDGDWYFRLVSELNNFQRKEGRRPVIFIDEFCQFSAFVDASDFLNRLTDLCEAGVSIVISSQKSLGMFSIPNRDLQLRLESRIDEEFVAPFDRSEFMEFCDLSPCSLKGVGESLWKFTHGHPHLAKQLIRGVLKGRFQNCSEAYNNEPFRRHIVMYWKNIAELFSSVTIGGRNWWRQICDYYLTGAQLDSAANSSLHAYGFFIEESPCQTLLDCMNEQGVDSCGSRHLDNGVPGSSCGINLVVDVKDANVEIRKGDMQEPEVISFEPAEFAILVMSLNDIVKGEWTTRLLQLACGDPREGVNWVNRLTVQEKGGYLPDKSKGMTNEDGRIKTLRNKHMSRIREKLETKIDYRVLPLNSSKKNLPANCVSWRFGTSGKLSHSFPPGGFPPELKELFTY